MATSGNTSWELSRNEIIEAAYRKLGIPGEGGTLTSTQYSDGNIALNSVLAMAVTDGMPLWKRTTATLTPSVTNQVYTVANAIKVAQVTLRDTSSGVQYELENKSLYDFKRLPYNTPGVPVSWTWQPTISGSTISIWPTVADSGSVSTKVIEVVYQKKFDGFTSTTTNTLDMPAYWHQPIIYAVAVNLAPENGIPIQDRQMLMSESKTYWSMASSYGDEDGSINFQPNQRGF